MPETKLPELTYDEFCALDFTYKRGVTFDTGAMRMYRNDAHGLQIEIHTKRKRSGDFYGGWGKQTKRYFFDSDDSQYTTIDQLYLAYMSKVCGMNVSQTPIKAVQRAVAVV